MEIGALCTAAADRFAPPVRTALDAQSRLAPNPGPGTLQWYGPGVPATARIFDALGHLELGHLPVGMYSVQVFDATGHLLMTQKVVLQP